MNYVLTGQDGLIGTYLKKELDKNNKCIMSIDQRSGINILSLDGIKLNPKTQHTDILFNTAAHCKINEGIQYPELPHINNCDGVHKVLEFCRRNNIKKIVNFSSSRVLSKEENTYTASKKYVENLTKAYYDCYGLEYIIVRPSTVYGPYKDITSRLMTDWCQNALENKELKIYGNENKTLDFTYVTDFVDGTMLLVNQWDKTKNQEYNISGEEEVNLTYLANLITKESNSKSKIKYYPPEIAQPQNVKVDISKMKELGYLPKVKIEQGVKKMVKWYFNNYYKEKLRWSM